jgi:hypothetical protein
MLRACRSPERHAKAVSLCKRVRLVGFMARLGLMVVRRWRDGNGESDSARNKGGSSHPDDRSEHFVLVHLTCV